MSGDKVIKETNGTDTIWYSYDTADNLISMNLNGTEYYYKRNAQMDIIGILDGTGTEVVSYKYDSWGNLISITGSLAETVGAINPYRYRGYRYDEETELYYLQSRYYNPEWGRFVNGDQVIGIIGNVLSHNLFAYCSNNPVNNFDPSGFIIETIFDIASLGWSVIDLIKNPSWSNLGYVIWDAAAAFMPFIPGSYTVKGTKLIFKVANRLGDLQKGAGLTLDTYSKLKKLYKGVKGIEIHHLIEKRFVRQLGVKTDKILSIPLDKELHRIITNRWRKEIAYGKNPTPKEVLKAVDKVYKDMPKLKNEIKKWLRRNGIK